VAEFYFEDETTTGILTKVRLLQLIANSMAELWTEAQLAQLNYTQREQLDRMLTQALTALAPIVAQPARRDWFLRTMQSQFSFDPREFDRLIASLGTLPGSNTTEDE